MVVNTIYKHVVFYKLLFSLQSSKYNDIPPLAMRRKRMLEHFSDLEQSYFNFRAKDLVFPPTGKLINIFFNCIIYSYLEDCVFFSQMWKDNFKIHPFKNNRR